MQNNSDIIQILPHRRDSTSRHKKELAEEKI